MLISELAKRTGLSAETIRFYEKQGLLDSSHCVRLKSNYRKYTQAAIERLEIIKRAKLLGFTLGEIQSFVAEWEGKQLSVEEKEQLITDKIKIVEQRINELEGTKLFLQQKLAAVRGIVEE